MALVENWEIFQGLRMDVVWLWPILREQEILPTVALVGLPCREDSLCQESLS